MVFMIDAPQREVCGDCVWRSFNIYARQEKLAGGHVIVGADFSFIDGLFLNATCRSLLRRTIRAT